jgi:hypothetical protein
LFFNDLLKHTPTEFPGYGTIKSALDLMAEVAANVDKKIRAEVSIVE